MRASKQKRLSVVLKTVCVLGFSNGLMSMLQLYIGFIGGSDALFADGLHTLLDLLMDGITYAACRLGSRPPDQRHAYGYRRIETLACILLSTLLCVIGLGVVYEAIFLHTGHHINGLHVVFVALFTMLVNEFLYRYAYKRASQINSDLLIASAAHQRSDALSSLVVLLSAILDMLFQGTYFDSIAAVIIGLLITKMGFKIAHRGILELLDEGIDTQRYLSLKRFMKSRPGVCDIHCLRTRKQAGDICLDVHIITDPFISVSEGHYIGEKLRRSVMKKFSDIVDVVVHIDPEDDTHLHDCDSDLPNRQFIEKKMNQYLPLGDYSYLIHYLDEKLYVDIMCGSQMVQSSLKKSLCQIQDEFHKEGVDLQIRFFVMIEPHRLSE